MTCYCKKKKKLCIYNTHTRSHSPHTPQAHSNHSTFNWVLRELRRTILNDTQRNTWDSRSIRGYYGPCINSLFFLTICLFIKLIEIVGSVSNSVYYHYWVQYSNPYAIMRVSCSYVDQMSVWCHHHINIESRNYNTIELSTVISCTLIPCSVDSCH